MAETNFPGNSTKTLPSTVGRHDGHHDGYLNCIAVRHGWTRTFSISPDELSTIEYEMLERILEINTLRIRPMGLRIFIEQPAESATFSKVRPWKHDNSLQSILVQKHLEERRAAGIITRFEVRDGAERRDEDNLSLRSVGSRIVHGMHHRGETTASTSSGRQGQGQGSWLGTIMRRRSTTKGKKKQPSTEEEDEVGEVGSEQPPEPPVKQSSSIFGYFNPLALFSSPPAPEVDAQNLISPEEARAAEVEQLRKRGWMPPGLARRQRSLRDRLRATEGHNPFLGGSRTYRVKKSSAGSGDAENPFADQDASEITPQEVDEFFEIDRTSSILELNNRPANMTPTKEKTWSRLKGGKNKKNKDKGKAKGELGGGADIVRQPEDAFPNSPHHSKHNVDKIDGGEE
ncbi:hypothetical protein B0H11DRAFT_2084531 [Mycena galericulata]|nr:hypothetical protein B0H11DRAFT_2084531 [Mycena galericulata]